MPHQDLARADRAAREASRLARAPRLPDGYPFDVVREDHANRWELRAHVSGAQRALEELGPKPEWGRPQRPRPGHELGRALADGAVELLVRARELERDAQQAQERAIEAIRWASSGGAYPWAKIGELLDLSPQGAFKRYRHVERPEPQITLAQAIADAEEPTS